MAIALEIFGLAFAAFCVWLIVRIVNRKERWAKRTLAAVVGVPTLYVAGITIQIWADYNLPPPKGCVADVLFAYAAPWRFIHTHASIPVGSAMHSYIDWVAKIGK